MIRINPVPVAEIFPEYSHSFEEFRNLLAQLDRTDALKHCIRLNLGLSTIEKVKNQRSLLPNFFTETQLQRFDAYSRRVPGTAAVFFRGQLLEFLRWICLLSEDQPTGARTFEDPEVRQKFGQAALAAGDIWSRRIYHTWGTPGDGSTMTQGNIFGPIRQATAESYPYTPEILQVLGRGDLLLQEHLPRHLPNFKQGFQDKTGLSIDEYYACLLLLTFLCLETPDNPDPLYFIDSQTIAELPNDFGKIFDKYLEIESQSINDLKLNLWGQTQTEYDLDNPPPYDMKPLREQPILLLPDNTLTVIDPLLYMDKTSMGPFFHFVKGRSDSQDLFSRLGKAFEDYVNGIFRRMYPVPAQPLVDRFKANPDARAEDGNIVEAADGFLSDMGRGVFIESKCKWIRDNMVLIPDSEQFVTYLRSQYRHRGEFQLANSIAKLGDELWMPVGWDLATVQRVFPILIAYDVLLSSFSYADFFAREFRDRLSPDRILDNNDMEKGNLHVTHLIVMTVDVLESLEKSINNFSLCDLLSDYLEHRTLEVDSLRSFIDNSKWKKQIDMNDSSVILKGLELMNRAYRIIDPAEFEGDDVDE